MARPQLTHTSGTGRRAVVASLLLALATGCPPGQVEEVGADGSTPFDAGAPPVPDAGQTDGGLGDAGRTDGGADAGWPNPGVDAGADAGCSPESDGVFCARLGKTCGRLAGADNCGVPRTVPSCGACGAAASCTPAGACEACANDGSRKFFGMFFSGAGWDSEGIEARVALPTPDRLTVVQDYQAPSSFNVASIAAAHARGNVVHLNVMPSGNTWSATVQQEFEAMGSALAQELVARDPAIPGILVTIGPEMNGTWTRYGCHLSDAGVLVPDPGAFVTLHNNAVATLRSKFQGAGLAPSRLRVIFGPNWSPAAGSPCDWLLYWPGWTHASWPGITTADFLGYSQYAFASDYRTPAQVVATAASLLQRVGAGLTDPAFFGRVVILQTGMEYGQPTHPRGTWIQGLMSQVGADEHLAGMILFQSPDYYPSRPEPLLRWLDYSDGGFAPLEGFAPLQSEVRTGSTFGTDVRYLFCP